MRKILLISVFFPVILLSQEIKVREVEKVTVPQKGQWTLSGVTPDGKALLLTGADMKGLYLLHLRKQVMTTITESPGSGYEPVFSTDGNKIYFRSDEYRNNRKYTSLESYDILTGNSTVISPPSRVLVPPAVSGTTLNYIIDGMPIHIDTDTDKRIRGDAGTFILLEDLRPVLYRNGKSRVVMPNGEGNYIWVSLSPDQKKIVYNFMGTCTYIADTAGNILEKIGRLNGPEWITNDLIAGMNDKDDGQRVISSDICCYSLRSKKLYNLTGTEDINEMYPHPFRAANTLACQTPEGDLFLIRFRIRRNVK